MNTRQFQRQREAHYAEEKQIEAERAEARLKGFKPATVADMTAAVFGIGRNKLSVEAERGINFNRQTRRRLRPRKAR